MRNGGWRAALVCVAAIGALAAPATVLGHTITERYSSPLPLIAYVAGAALAVAMSFVFVSLRERRAQPTPRPRRPRQVAPPIRWLLRGLGLLGWAWVMAQAFFGGNDASADVANVVLWIFGWVGVALVSALIGPIWAWLDPFSTMHLLLVGAARRLGLLSPREEDDEEAFTDGDDGDDGDDDGDTGRRYPERLGRWPAVIGFGIVIWLELVAFVTGGRALAMLLLAYTLISLAGMAYFGRATWRRNVDVFSVWFGVLGRLAPFVLTGEPEDNEVVRRPFGSGLFPASWTRAELTLVTLGTASIIFDGLSQTMLYFDLFGRIELFGLPSAAPNTLILVAWFGLLVGLVFAVARRIGVNALGAGLLPVAVGYLIAHYLVTLIFDGQRIIIALNDPLVHGTSLLPYPLSNMSQPWVFLPASIIWTIELAAVVGGHVVGAWAGHMALAEERQGAQLSNQLPLAALMVTFTTITLWSLGQAVFEPTTHGDGGRPPPVAVALDRDDRAGT